MTPFCTPTGQEFNLQLSSGYEFTVTLCHTEYVSRHVAQPLPQTGSVTVLSLVLCGLSKGQHKCPDAQSCCVVQKLGI